MRVEFYIGGDDEGAENSFPASRQRQENTFYIWRLKKIQYCWKVHDGRVVKKSEAEEIIGNKIMESLHNLVKELGRKESKKGNVTWLDLHFSVNILAVLRGKYWRMMGWQGTKARLVRLWWPGWSSRDGENNGMWGEPPGPELMGDRMESVKANARFLVWAIVWIFYH